MKEKITVIEEIEVVHRKVDGTIVSKRTINNSFWTRFLCKLGLKHNSMTKDGFTEIASLIVADVGGTAFDYIAIGTGNTASTVNDTELEVEIARKAAVGTLVETTHANDTCQWVITFSSGDGLSGTDEVCEIGVLNADENGVLLLRQVYSPADTCNWTAGDTLQVTVKCQIKQGSA